MSLYTVEPNRSVLQTVRGIGTNLAERLTPLPGISNRLSEESQPNRQLCLSKPRLISAFQAPHHRSYITEINPWRTRLPMAL